VNRPAMLGRNAVKSREFVLVTLHRPALVDDPEKLGPTMEVLADIAGSLPVLFPVHPRTRERLAGSGAGWGKVILTPPMDYDDFIALEAEARLVITDSGGVQEETTVLGTPCLTYRTTTERPITVEQGTNELIGVDPSALKEAAERSLAAEVPEQAPEIPLWDGKAGPRAAAAIETFLNVKGKD
jgi:UDP-N-acetylglucosamine 2-epimerase (non-hydrolysing)